MISFLLSAAIFFAILSVLVLIHELGHFLTARFFGVRVEEFGLGFPPKAFTITKKNGTEYTLNWLPLGGFVRLKGEQGEDSNDENSFVSKPIWQRIVILVAGVAMNLFLTIGILAVGFMIGMPTAVEGIPAGARVQDEKIQITHIQKASPAEAVSLKIGDTILAIDGDVMESVDEVRAFTKSHLDKVITMRVKRGSEEISKEVKVELLRETKEPGIGIGLVKTGIVSYPIHIALIEAVKSTGYLTQSILTALVGAVRHGSVDSFVGPVGIAVHTSEATQLGLTYFLFLVAQLSLSLAIMNVLPIPALDGGRILFALIEKVRGRSLRPALENVIHLVGFALLIGLIILITFKDIARLWPR